MEDYTAVNTSLSGHPIYISGKDGKESSSYGNMSLKDRIVVELSSYSFVRANPSQMQGRDVVDNYVAIVSSSAFVFVLSKQSVTDPQCLNQLGMALSYNIPTITVRDQDFELPKPLPTRYYQTEIVDKTGVFHNEKRIPNNLENLPSISTLASALSKLYSASIVYNFHNQAEFSEQLLRLLLDSCRESKVFKVINSSGSDASSSGDDADVENKTNERNGAANSVFIYSPYREKVSSTKDNMLFQKERYSVAESKQQMKDRSGNSRKRAKSRTSGKSKSAHNSRTSCSPVVTNGQALNFNISVIPPSPAPQSPVSFRRGLYTRTSKAIKGLNIGTAKLNLAYRGEISNLSKPKGRVKFGNKMQKKENVSDDTKENDAAAADTHGNDREISCTVPNNSAKKEDESSKPSPGVQKKRFPRHSLRRYSSLPVIPTQYLVTSRENKNRPTVYHYPPGATTPIRHSITSPQYSAADEDEYESIHLSRTCTPVLDIETDAGYVTPTSPTH